MVNANEQAVLFANARGQKLVGVWHAAQSREAHGEATGARATIVMLHGWSGYRTGPHQMLVRAARLFASLGHGVLRFDFAGRGDSEGESEETTLATMANDARAALSWLAARDANPVVLLGLCSGCEVAFALASEPNVGALCLWSAPVFAAGQDDAETSSARRGKRGAMLKTYARKALRPATWLKVLTGRVDRAAVGRAVSGGGGEIHRNREDGSVGHLPRGWRADALARFDETQVARLLVYGTADATTETALAWHRARGSHATRDATTEHLVAGANHSFYGLAWEREVFEVTARWLD